MEKATILELNKSNERHCGSKATKAALVHNTATE